ncbi:MAG: hypothetical protein RLZZ511_3854 [Cyanobacteriota bacterium]
MGFAQELGDLVSERAGLEELVHGLIVHHFRPRARKPMARGPAEQVIASFGIFGHVVGKGEIA